MAPQDPDCSVVLVTWNRLEELKVALASIDRQTIRDRVEVLVVDNGSTDGTVEWLRAQGGPAVRVLCFARNQGACHGRNAGIRAARAPFVCFLDSDAEIQTDDALERCLARLARSRPAVRAVSGLIWHDRERTYPFSKGVYCTPEGHYAGAWTRSRTDDPHALSTCFSVWEKSLLEELGGFDPWYFWGVEDIDLALRAYHRALRGEARGASRYEILEEVHILHEMSRKGRHYQWDDFERAFHAIERQRLHLVLAYGGVGEFFRAWGRSFRNRHRITALAWERRLPKRLWLWLLVLYPLNRLARMPFDLRAIRRDHLASAPQPVEMDRE